MLTNSVNITKGSTALILMFPEITEVSVREVPFEDNEVLEAFRWPVIVYLLFRAFELKLDLFFFVYPKLNKLLLLEWLSMLAFPWLYKLLLPLPLELSLELLLLLELILELLSTSFSLVISSGL